MSPYDYKEYIKKGVITFNYCLVKHCNLNCIGCRMYSPLADEWYADINQYIDDLNELYRIGFRENTVAIGYFGGEPLLHPKIIDFITKTRASKFRNIGIGISTNGLKFPNMGARFYNILRRNKVGIYFSNYILSKEFSCSKIKEICEKYNVRLNNVDDDDTCRNKFTIDGECAKIKFALIKNDPKGRYDRETQYQRCGSIFPTIHEGKLYPCVIPFIDNLNKAFGTDFKLIEGKDYLVLKNIKCIDEIKDFLTKSIPFCKYCGSDWIVDTKNELVDWRKSNKIPFEWLVNDYES